MACEGCEGFVDVFFSVVITFWPAMYMGYSRPNSAATLASACSMRLRFSGREKSRNGSFTNSENWGLVSAVAIWISPKECSLPILLRDSAGSQGEGGGASQGLVNNHDRSIPGSRGARFTRWRC